MTGQGEGPIVELDVQYSDPAASPTPWSRARNILDEAGVYWLSTVRPDGRPHVTPVAGVWMNSSLYFCTGPDERKAKNLARNRNVVVTTGCNAFREGLDVVVEGVAETVTREGILGPLADLFETKYEGTFGFTVRDGRFAQRAGGVADVYEVAPVKVFAYGRDEVYSATRMRFNPS